jgi:hypothetical protein
MVLVRLSIKVRVDGKGDPRLDILDPCFIETAREVSAGLESPKGGSGTPSLKPVATQDLWKILKSMNG